MQKYLLGVFGCLLGVCLLGCLTSTAEQTRDSEPPVHREHDARWHQRRYQRLLEEIVPDGKPNPQHIQTYIDYFKVKTLSDRNQYAFDVNGEQDKGKVLLEGSVEFERIHQSLIEFIKFLDLGEVQDQIAVLPHRDLGEKTIGIVREYSTFLCRQPREPRDRGETINQIILGDTVFLLDKVEDWYLLHSHSGYVGYCPADKILALSPEEHTAYMSRPMARVNDEFRSGKIAIPISSLLPVEKRKPESFLLQLPGGDSVLVPNECVQFPANATPHRINQVIETAKDFLNVPYVWGAKTKTGADCSGFLQTAFRTHGMALPRDAYQQSLCGELVATRWYRQPMRAGDLMFFLGRRGNISHVALYLGEDKYINSSDGRVQVHSLNPEHPEYNEHHAEGFAFAKRILVN